MLFRIVFAVLMFQSMPAFAHYSTFQGCEIQTAWQILDIENHRTFDAPLLGALVRGEAVAEIPSESYESCRMLAVRAMGRTGVAASLQNLSTVFENGNVTLKREAALAIGLTGGADAVSILREKLSTETDESVRGMLSYALGRNGDAADVARLFEQFIMIGDQTARAEVVQGLGMLWMKDSAAWDVPQGLLNALVSTVVSQNQQLATAAAFSLARYKGKLDSLSNVDAPTSWAEIKHQSAKAYFLRFVGKFKSEASAKWLCRKELHSREVIGVRVEALRALGQLPTKPVCADAVFLRGVTSNEGQMVQQSLEIIERVNWDFSADLRLAVAKIAASGSGIRSLLAGKSFARLSADEAKVLARAKFASSNIEDLRLALRIVSGLTDRAEFLDNVVALIGRSEALVSSEALSAIAEWTDEERARVTGGVPALQEATRLSLLTLDIAKTSTAADVAMQLGWRELAPTLADVLLKMTASDLLESKISLLAALKELGGVEQKAALEEALKDDERLVALAAAEALEKISGESYSAHVPVVSRITATTPSIDEIIRATQSQVLLQTSKGKVVLQMSAMAPLTATSFVGLVKAGFYTDKAFHRVVPHFVVQGGDPRGDGYGGAGFLIRDEVSGPWSHVRGAVGVATAGKDTGGSQIFIDHDPNMHLDGAYTVFANVVSGMKNVGRLEMGDRIIRARVWR
jgi:cyclophilin family peptidyl-prolyl cis-trans isomerase/HEAT repeat protein